MIVKDLEQLKQECKEVSSLEEGMEIVKRLEAELADSPRLGVGLAANQIGIQKKVFIMRYKNPHTNKEYNIDFINPVLEEKYGCFKNENEGCLSFDKNYDTIRYSEVFFKSLNFPEGVVLTDFPAVIASHEYDHTMGKVMSDRQWPKGLGRNDKCPCDSGRKYKKCCLAYNV
jgi:peptide deformylase